MFSVKVKNWKSRVSGLGMVLATLLVPFRLQAYPLYGEPTNRLNILTDTSTATSISIPQKDDSHSVFENSGSFTIPFMVPLEATIGRFQLGSDSSLNARISTPGLNDPIYRNGTVAGRVGFYAPISSGKTKRYSVDLMEAVTVDPASGSREVDPRLLPGGSLRPNYSIDTGIAFSYLLESAWFRLGISHVIDMEMAEEELPENSVNASIIMGYGFGKGSSIRKPIHFTVGITSTYYYSPEYAMTDENRNLASSEYGTVFFAPGLQLSGSSMVFQAHLELPIHQIRNGSTKQIETESLNPSVRDEMRANIGMKYYLK